MKRAFVATVLLVLCVAPANAGQDLARAMSEDYRESLADLFVWFHSHPELSFREYRTAARLAEELRAAGVEVTEGVGGTGVVGMLHNGDGPLVMVRADMDGLPIREDTGLAHSSTVTQVDITGIEQPVMHACGHDVHVTSMVGTAKRLVAMRDRWSGTVMFVGQPAEERVGGVKAMLEDRLPKVEVTEGTPPTVNDDKLAARIHAAFVRDLGEDAVYEKKREGMGAEDFAFFVITDDDVPGAYFSVGGTSQADLDAEEAGGTAVPSHHSPLFKIEPEPSVTMGVEAMTVAVLELLGAK